MMAIKKQPPSGWIQGAVAKVYKLPLIYFESERKWSD